MGELLGRGGMAEVFAGSSVGDHGFQKPVAIKRLLPELANDDVFVERLLGIRLGADQVNRGKAFVQGVVDRGGEQALLPLLEVPGSLPTPSEVDAPGLWLARVTGE